MNYNKTKSILLYEQKVQFQIIEYKIFYVVAWWRTVQDKYEYKTNVIVEVVSNQNYIYRL